MEPALQFDTSVLYEKDDGEESASLAALAAEPVCLQAVQNGGVIPTSCSGEVMKFLSGMGLVQKFDSPALSKYFDVFLFFFVQPIQPTCSTKLLDQSHWHCIHIFMFASCIAEEDGSSVLVRECLRYGSVCEGPQLEISTRSDVSKMSTLELREDMKAHGWSLVEGSKSASVAERRALQKGSKKYYVAGLETFSCRNLHWLITAG